MQKGEECMKPTFAVIHSIPGRIRFHIPMLATHNMSSNIEKMFENIQGIQMVKVQKITSSLMVKYDSNELNHLDIIRYVNLYFSVQQTPTLNRSKQDIRQDLQHSVLSGSLLLASYYRKNTAVNTTIFDYLMVMTTSYTVASHSENKLTQPDLIKTLVAMISSGTGGTLQAALVAYILNLLQVLGSARRQSQLQYAY